MILITNRIGTLLSRILFMRVGRFWLWSQVSELMLSRLTNYDRDCTNELMLIVWWETLFIFFYIWQQRIYLITRKTINILLFWSKTHAKYKSRTYWPTMIKDLF